MAQENKNNNGLKIALGILLVLLLGAGAFMFKMHSDAEAKKEELKGEISLINEDLDKYITMYKEMETDNQSLKKDLNAKIAKLEETKASLAESEATVQTLVRYKSRFFSLKKEHDELLVKYHILEDENKNLVTQVATKDEEIKSQLAVNDSLTQENIAQAETINAAKELTVTGLSGSALIVKSSGKQIATDKARRTDQVKICFSVPANKLTDEGDRSYYIQVIDPKRNVVGDKETISVGGKSL
ncbi:MAG: hypothetical protein HRT68_16530, partial [Flavobacteriaceae bacterium]|nr:hypothetical protein [Flavobacteriaceae bacterium]